MLAVWQQIEVFKKINKILTFFLYYIVEKWETVEWGEVGKFARKLKTGFFLIEPKKIWL